VDDPEVFLEIANIPVAIMTPSAESHQVVKGVGSFATTHSTSVYVMYVTCLAFAYLAGDEISLIEAHP
jgi:hypothetical protein